jgi:hypothetical protein
MQPLDRIELQPSERDKGGTSHTAFVRQAEPWRTPRLRGWFTWRRQQLQRFGVFRQPDSDDAERYRNCSKSCMSRR